MQITKAFRFALLPCACAIAGPAMGQTAVSQERVTAGDVATTPLSDFNIKKDEVPAMLVSARDKPYEVSGLKRCPAIATEISKLDAVLGDDIDIARDDDKGAPKVGNMAKSLVSSLIPFGGVIREISGANAQQRKWNEAIYAGSVRRAFLKGVGEQRGCKYPARSATAKDSATLWAARDAAEASGKDEKDKDNKDSDKKKVASKDANGKPVKFESKTVVQPVN